MLKKPRPGEHFVGKACRPCSVHMLDLRFRHCQMLLDDKTTTCVLLVTFQLKDTQLQRLHLKDIVRLSILFH